MNTYEKHVCGALKALIVGAFMLASAILFKSFSR